VKPRSRFKYTENDLAAIEAEAAERGGDDLRLRDNYLFSSLFNRENGVQDGRALSRREWIETFFTIKPKAAGLQRITLNPAQRRLHSTVEKMIRLNLPVRIICLKARQQGFSTDIQAMMFEDVLRGQNKRGLIVADIDDRAEMLLKIANTARKNMPKSERGDSRWDFKMDSRAAYQLAWGDPITGSIDITSSQTSGAGRGGTLDCLHLTETAFWKDAASQAVGILESLPDLPGTMAFNESTANGDSGWFRDEFWRAWEERDRPLWDRKSSWVSLFFGWWEHPDYRWTKTFGAGREFPARLSAQIFHTVDAEEEWLLQQRYFQRGAGWKTVDYDQLAWRRKKIADYTGKGGVDKFNQEYPSRPEVAFMSSGFKVFDQDVIQRKLREAKKPVWTGTIEEPFARVGAPSSYDDEAFEDQIINP
jgi:hypothetical protein